MLYILMMILRERSSRSTVDEGAPFRTREVGSTLIFIRQLTVLTSYACLAVGLLA